MQHSPTEQMQQQYTTQLLWSPMPNPNRQKLKKLNRRLKRSLEDTSTASMTSSFLLAMLVVNLGSQCKFLTRSTFLKLLFSKQKQPRPKRVPSTTENLEDDKRKHMSQPVPNQLTNVEQKNKAKKRRESRRSTQGVTLDIVKEAKNFVEETKKESKRKNITTGSTAGKFFR